MTSHQPLTPEEEQVAQEILFLMDRKEDLDPYNKIYSMFPDTGPLRRGLYPKHVKAFEMTAKYPQVSFCGGNQTGKSEWGSTQLSYHLTGKYPSWWNGKRYNRPIRAALYAITNTQLRDASGAALFGEGGNLGTGSIPKEDIIKTHYRQGQGRFIDNVSVKWYNEKGEHAGESIIYCFTENQGREAIQGIRKLDIIWFDEEPKPEIYTEALMRTAASDNPLILLTFTPLKGLSEVALRFFPDGQLPITFPGSTYVEQVSWDDVPHLSEEHKKFMIGEMTPMEIEARTKGIPVAGIGMVFPVPNDVIAYRPFRIPDDWPRVYGFDFSARRAAVIFVAQDPKTNVLYLYDIFTTKTFDYIQISNAIRIRGGDWMYGIAETKPRASLEGTITGHEVFKQEYGLNLVAANQTANHKHLAIAKTYNMLSTGRFRVAEHLTEWFAEKNVFHYEDKPDPEGKPKVHKYFDDLMDATIYVCDKGIRYLRVNPDFEEEDEDYDKYDYYERNKMTGY